MRAKVSRAGSSLSEGGDHLGGAAQGTRAEAVVATGACCTYAYGMSYRAGQPSVKMITSCVARDHLERLGEREG